MPKAKPIPANEQLQDLPFPVNGLDTGRAFAEQVALTTPVGQNVRTYEPLGLRARGGSRPGLAKYILPQLPSGAFLVQNLNTVDPTENGALLDWQLTWDGVSPVPDGFFLDTSTPGSSLDWGAVPVSLGENTRAPSRLIRTGGSGIQLNKNNKRTLRVPTITWANPADISAGTPLGGTQLNATATDPITLATVPGSLVYTPASGTVLAQGSSQPLYVVFYPSDPTVYTINAKTVHINVGVSTAIVFKQATGDDVPWRTTAAGGLIVPSEPFVSDVTSGSLLLLWLSPQDSRVNSISVTDNLGNIWSMALEADNPLGGGIGVGLTLWWTVTTVGGPCTVSATFNDNFSGTGVATMAVLEYANTDALTPLDSVSTHNSVSDTICTTLPITVNNPGSMIIGGFHAVGVIPIKDAGFNERVVVNSINKFWDKLNVGGATAITGTLSPAARYWAGGASFKKV